LNNSVKISLVSQEPTLYGRTIAENIAYAWPHATPATYEQIVEAAKLANAHNFIIQMPKGYETQVGEKGVTLSGKRNTLLWSC
jgi:ABC-type multidrug transport system fused ATPase/permease subunit